MYAARTPGLTDHSTMCSSACSVTGRKSNQLDVWSVLPASPSDGPATQTSIAGGPPHYAGTKAGELLDGPLASGPRQRGGPEQTPQERRGPGPGTSSTQGAGGGCTVMYGKVRHIRHTHRECWRT